MRSATFLRNGLAAAFLILAPTLALSEGGSHVFVVDNSDGYGIDACLASGAPCGQGMADAWCRAHDFKHAASFGKLKSDAILASASSAPLRTACTGATCSNAAVITCAR